MSKINRWKDRTTRFKTEVICYSYTHTIKETAAKYDLPISTVSRWRINESKRINKYIRSKAS